MNCEIQHPITDLMNLNLMEFF